MSRLCLLVLISCVNYYVAGNDFRVSCKAYFKHKIIPDVLTVAPKGYLKVLHTSGAEVQEGNVLSPIDLQAIDTVSWNATDKLYTIVMVDPDVPSRESPISRAFLHWLLVNVPGADTDDEDGDTIANYIGPGPPATTGLHRYVFLVYQQNEALDVQELIVTNGLAVNRTFFSIGDFAQKYNLGDPIAGNFYQAKFDTKLPNLNQPPGL